MIKYHPTPELLASHSAAQLPLSLSIAVSAHLEMCTQCQAAVRQITTQHADLLWSEQSSPCIDFSAILNNIFEHKPELPVKPKNDLPRQSGLHLFGNPLRLPAGGDRKGVRVQTVWLLRHGRTGRFCRGVRRPPGEPSQHRFLSIFLILRWLFW